MSLYRKLILLIKTFLYSVVGVLSIIAVLFLFGGAIADGAINYTLNCKTSLSQKDKSINSGYEDDFLKFTNQTETLSVQTLENIQQTQSDSVAVNLSALSGKYTKINGTAVINNTDYDVTSLLNANYKKPETDKDKPAVLIYHTHTSEGYDGGGTVVDVGREMAAEFERMGYKTIHLTETYDKEQFSGAYSRSIEGITEALKQNPSIKLVFDVHRDAITDASGKQYRPITDINGEKAAQVMFVCGTDEKGLKHPDWRENFKFALDVSRTLGEEYNGLSRPVNLRGDRFNTHVTRHAFIIEVGSEKNTLAEATLAVKYTARSIVKTIEKSE